ILCKPARLTKEEFEIIKQHPIIGTRIIEPIKPLQKILPGMRHHHERYDGRGYPDGLKGREIPLFGRIISVADTYDAMTSDRSYRKGLSSDIALEEIQTCAGTQFDPMVVEAFFRVVRDSKIQFKG
ncbi:MAG: HD domain-containing phosphohydrolase, partial [bacterium]|nr:HD domain-containing phosphohydrolase [bacterium]